ncbi:DUF3857 domain-containing protein [Neotabrizicola sp. VNH66]|uniref:DUF3857 domain-containing protein n=1 Tax=Neotabrizicola sp. VNH66 TaxID=3400918 RepID=UPI003C106CD6
MRHFLISLLCLVFAPPALAQELARSDPPDWVEILPLPPEDPALMAEATGGLHYLLADHQIRFQGEVREEFMRDAMLVMNRAGLETAATIELEFDPAFENVTLTRLAILRDGREIDLRAQVVPEVLRREEQLEDGIVDGLLTYWIQVPGLRVGDVLDYASHYEIRPAIPDAGASVFSVLEWQVPMVLSRTVVFWPDDWPQVMAPLPDRVSRMEGPGPGGTQRLEFQRFHHLPLREEDYAPAGDGGRAVLRLSSERDWGTLSAALTPYYAADYPLTPEWEARVAAIAAESEDPAVRAVAALRMVQDELRYASLSVGAGGYFARLPEEVIRSGFGDCKEKALILRVMLDRLGIAAAVALTDLDQGRALPQKVPAPGVFDHMILRMALDGQVHWLDPTVSHQAGTLDHATPPDYGWALPLTGAGQAALEEVAAPPERVWSTFVTERYRFSGLGVFLEVTSEYRAGAADSMRYRVANETRRDLTEGYLDYYRERMPGLSVVREIEVTDDRDANLIILRESYYLSPMALRDEGLDKAFPFATEDFASSMPEKLPQPRLNPMATGDPGDYRHRIEVSGLDFDFTPPAAVRLDNPAFSYRLEGKAEAPGTMVLDWHYRGTGADVPAAGVAAVLKDRREVYETTWFTWDVAP